MAWLRRHVPVEPGATLQGTDALAEWGRSRFNGMFRRDPTCRCRRAESARFPHHVAASGPTLMTGGVTSIRCPSVTLVVPSSLVW